MRKTIPVFLAVVMLASVLQGCAVLKPGADQFLTRAEQSYDIAFWSVDALFQIEKVTPELDALVPGAHAAVNQMRLNAPPIFIAAMNAMDAYRASPTKDETAKARVTQSIAVAQSLAQDATKWLEKVKLAKGGK